MKDCSAARRTRHDDGLTLRPCLVPLPSTRMVLGTQRLASARALRMRILSCGGTDPRNEPRDLRAQAGFLQAAPPAKRLVHPLSRKPIPRTSRRSQDARCKPNRQPSIEASKRPVNVCAVALTGRSRARLGTGWRIERLAARGLQPSRLETPVLSFSPAAAWLSLCVRVAPGALRRGRLHCRPTAYPVPGSTSCRTR